MKKFTRSLLIIGLLVLCSMGAYASHIHDWSSYWDYEKNNSSTHKKTRICYDCDEVDTVYENHNWKHWSYNDRQYNDTYHYAYYECKDCGEEKYVLEKHELESIPSYYSYWSDTVCNAEYRCKDCSQYIKKATSHNWKLQTANYDYNYVNATYHKKSQYCECSKCYSTKDIGVNEKHTLQYIKGNGTIYYGCKVCNYNVGNKFIFTKLTVTSKVKKGKKGTISVPILAKDGIKKYKITAGKKLITVKKKSKSKLTVKTKKKGTAKVKITTKSGAVYTCVIKIK